jgi:hypothetical protein
VAERGEQGIEVRTSVETPHNAALYEAGKHLIVQSLEVGREFCKFMIGVCTGAIPVYLALVGLAAGRAYRPGFAEGVVLLVPPVLFLAAAGIFAWGYFPVPSRFSADLPHEIEAARAENMDRRYRAAKFGFGLFAVATCVALGDAVYALSLR